MSFCVFEQEKFDVRDKIPVRRVLTKGQVSGCLRRHIDTELSKTLWPAVKAEEKFEAKDRRGDANPR